MEVYMYFKVHAKSKWENKECNCTESTHLLLALCTRGARLGFELRHRLLQVLLLLRHLQLALLPHRHLLPTPVTTSLVSMESTYGSTFDAYKACSSRVMR